MTDSFTSYFVWYGRELIILLYKYYVYLYGQRKKSLTVNMAIRGQNILDDIQSVSHTVQGRKTLLLPSVLGNRTILASFDTDWFFFIFCL